MNSPVIYLSSNQNLSDPKKAGTHNMVLHNNYHYWWAEDNEKSTRYTCIERAIKKCSGSLTIAGDKVIRSSGHC